MSLSGVCVLSHVACCMNDSSSLSPKTRCGFTHLGIVCHRPVPKEQFILKKMVFLRKGGRRELWREKIWRKVNMHEEQSDLMALRQSPPESDCQSEQLTRANDHLTSGRGNVIQEENVLWIRNKLVKISTTEDESQLCHQLKYVCPKYQREYKINDKAEKKKKELRIDAPGFI